MQQMQQQVEEMREMQQQMQNQMSTLLQALAGGGFPGLLAAEVQMAADQTPWLGVDPGPKKGRGKGKHRDWGEASHARLAPY